MTFSFEANNACISRASGVDPDMVIFLAVANSFVKIAQIKKIHGARFGTFAPQIEDGTLF